MRRLAALVLCLALMGPGAARGAEKKARPKLYTARICTPTRVYAGWSGTEPKDPIGTLPKKVRVIIHELNPTFALVSCEARKITGYVKRVCIDEAVPVNSKSTPPYGVEFNTFYSTIAAKDAPVTTQPGKGKTLITLHKGAKVSFIGFENGYGKLIYHRQYAYIDSRHLGELIPVYSAPESAGTDAPIAAFTSFYNIADSESNINRMANIAVACEKLCRLPLGKGASLNFNAQVGPYRAANGYKPAGVLIDGELQQGYGGGTCQVSSTLYNVVLQLPGITVLQRRAHGANGAPYLPMGTDAAVGNKNLNLRFRNDYPFPLRIAASSQDGALTIAVYRK